jgi:hypothetical protein
VNKKIANNSKPKTNKQNISIKSQPNTRNRGRKIKKPSSKNLSFETTKSLALLSFVLNTFHVCL